MVNNAVDCEVALRKVREVLEQEYSVKKVQLFGSFARGTANAKSDVDLLVEFNQVPGFIKLAILQNYLESILGRKVDLVTYRGLKPIVMKSIKNDLTLIYG